jgi:hypothetical protein
MGSLKPGTKYIYEHANGITYAREFSAPHNERFEIGRTIEKQSLIDDLREQKLWGNIHRAAKTNHLLREALERVIMLYHLSRQHDKEI